MTSIDFGIQVANQWQTLKGFTSRFTIDDDESADLVQETILKALTYRHHFKEDVNLTGWLYTIMRNTFINSYRKNKIHRTTHDTSRDLYFLNAEDDHTFNLPDARCEYKDVLQEIGSLKEELLMPFKMHLTGYKYYEIARELGIPMGTVKNRIHQARVAIRHKLSDH